MTEKSKGWIGVDLDGTLAEYHGWKGVDHIGAPIPAMVARVKAWLAEGKDVRIFTARVGVPNQKERAAVHSVINAWCETYIGQRLKQTNKKDMAMVELWDDRAIQVEKNTGRRMDGAT